MFVRCFVFSFFSSSSPEEIEFLPPKAVQSACANLTTAVYGRELGSKASLNMMKSSVVRIECAIVEIPPAVRPIWRSACKHRAPTLLIFTPDSRSAAARHSLPLTMPLVEPFLLIRFVSTLTLAFSQSWLLLVQGGGGRGRRKFETRTCAFPARVMHAANEQRTGCFATSCRCSRRSRCRERGVCPLGGAMIVRCH